MTRIVHGRTELLTSFDPRAQSFRVNGELSTGYNGHAQETFFEPRGHFLNYDRRTLDHLSLGSRAKDEIYPDVSELVTNMDRMTSCPPTIKESVKVWEATLKPMAASDEMTGKIFNYS